MVAHSALILLVFVQVTVSSYTTAVQSLTTVDFFMNIISTTIFDAFAKGEILQVLLFSIMYGVATNVVSRWENEFDAERADKILNGMDVEDLPSGVMTESI